MTGTSSIIPPNRPDLTLEEAMAFGKQLKQLALPFILGVRGYENPGANATGVYDDCIALVDQVNFETFNANTDPSKHGRGMATVIAPQVCLYKLGIHNLHKEPQFRYEALVQAKPIFVKREGIDQELPAGWFGINIHRGGTTTPGSEGCQTLPPSQYDDFIMTVKNTMQMRNISTIPYVLIELQ